MSDLWTLCPISKPAMEQCVANAGTRNERNKWLEEFKKKHTDSEFGKNLYRLIKETGDALDQKETEESEEEKYDQAQALPASELDEELLMIPEATKDDGMVCKRNLIEIGECTSAVEVAKRSFDREMDELVQMIETEPILRFELMLEEGTKYSVLLNILAERLTESTVNKISRQLFDAKGIDLFHVKVFYTNFFPVYFKRWYTNCSLDLLVKARTAYPKEFPTLLKTLLQDVQVSNKMMYDFVLTMDTAGKLEFLTIALELELDTPEFLHNITAINKAYIDSEKSEMIQMYVYKCLLKHATKCIADKNYGKLMLRYLEAVDSLQGKLNFMYFDSLIKIHRSQFARPCNLLFMDMIKKATEEHVNPTMPKIQGIED